MPFKVVIHHEVIRHVAVLLPFRLIKLHKEGYILKGVCKTVGTVETLIPAESHSHSHSSDCGLSHKRPPTPGRVRRIKSGGLLKLWQTCSRGELTDLWSRTYVLFGVVVNDLVSLQRKREKRRALKNFAKCYH